MKTQLMKLHIEQILEKHKSVIAETDQLVRPLLESLNIEEIAKFNAGFKRYKENPFAIMEGEKLRYVRVLEMITNARKTGNICDLGTFVPYLPIMLASLGYEVTIVDHFKFYGPHFESEIRSITAKKSIKVVDLDILNDGFEPLGSHDIVLLMAVLEHLNGTPKALMQKIRSLCRQDGFVLIEVPNIVEFSKRIQMILGRSPLPDYATYFESAYPFMGHNREMTISEVLYLMNRTGFNVQQLFCYDYAPYRVPTFKGWLVQMLKKVVPLRDKGEVISVIANPRP